MKRVEQHVIEKTHPQFRALDEMALASKNLWNLANYHVRQAFILNYRVVADSSPFLDTVIYYSGATCISPNKYQEDHQ